MRAALAACLEARPVREVRGESDCPGAARRDFGDRAIECLLPARDQRDRNALSRERVGDAAAESFAAAENQRRFSFQLKIHFPISPVFDCYAFFFAPGR